MNIPFRPLGKVKELTESIGYEISYAYDDLVFSDHSFFILQFHDDDPSLLSLYFNSDCEIVEQTIVQAKLIMAGKSVGFKIIYKSNFTISQIDEEENLNIIFHN